mgnify:CR=1 FL=1|jgi:hypothetical protein
MNILPAVWGPQAWGFLYSIALGYPNTPTPAEKEAMKSFMLAMKQILPCEKCRRNFTAKLDGAFGQRLDAAVQCSEALVQYVYDLESAVAETNGKTICNIDDAIKGAVQKHARVDTATSDRGSNLVALWVLLPVGVVLASVVTWMITRKAVKK